MKTKLILCLALVLSGLQPNCFGAVDSTQTRLEQMARTYSHFSLTVVIRNQELRLGPTMEQFNSATNASAIWQFQNNPLTLEQLQLVKELRALSGDRKTLAALLEHPDPKVRTLALGAIFSARRWT